MRFLTLCLLVLWHCSAFAAESSKDFIFPLNKPGRVITDAGSITLALYDHGSEITYRINYGTPIKVTKVRGFESRGDNLTLIHQSGRLKVYFVDTAACPAGTYVARAKW